MKKFANGIKKFVCNFWVQLSFFVLLIAAILLLHFLPKPEGSLWETIDNMISNSSAMSGILVAAGTLILARVLFKYKTIAEEGLKIEADHHKIVCKYKDYSTAIIGQDENFFDKKGVYMSLFNVDKTKKKYENPYKDEYSDDYKARQRDVNFFYQDGRLFLPNVSIFANVLGNVRVQFDDSTDYHVLPHFMNEYAVELLQAHETSKFSNNTTIRLSGADYKDGILTIKTCRSYYYDMLITNRCMDFKLSGGVTLRAMFESGSTVSKLENSRLGNQIGINGLIFTKDGYILVEKRGRKKSVWKNKFAQPISLAMKEVDLGVKGAISNTPEAAENCFKNIILKTVKNNFGLTENDINEFTLSNNFMGIARDLLEGGKPNAYFYVVANMTARELQTFIQDKFRTSSELGAKEKISPSVTLDKLESEYYLIKYEDIFVDYDYALEIKARKILRIKRKYCPRVSRTVQRCEGAKYRFKKAFDGSIKRGCGDALLACMYYANVCKSRIKKELDGE